MSTQNQGRFPVAKNLEVNELLEAYDGILPDVDKVLEEAQISAQVEIPQAPKGLESVVLYGINNDPFPPEDLTEITALQLGQLMSYLQSYANYVQAECTRTKTQLEIQTKRNSIVESALRLFYKETGVPSAHVDDHVKTDSRYVECDVEFEKIRAYYRACESRYEQLKRSLNNISREQTRRAEELERALQEQGGGGYPTPAQGGPNPFRRHR